MAAVQKTRQAQFSGGLDRRSRVAMRQAALDGDRIVDFVEHHPAFQCGADGIDHRARQVGEIGEGFVHHAFALAV